MTQRSHYEVLGVARSADDKEIKTAYLKRVKTAHPDKGGRADDFQEVQAAYAVLGNTIKRRQYDDSNETFDHMANEAAEDDAFREHCTKQTEWEANARRRRETWAPGKGSRTGYGYGRGDSKEEWFARSGFTMPGKQKDRSLRFNVDLWEQAHQLGRWGHGAEADLRLRDYYVRIFAQEEDSRAAKEGQKLTKEQAYFRRRNERERKRMEEFMKAAQQADKGSKRELHTQACTRVLKPVGTVKNRQIVGNGCSGNFVER